jgi:hypothetical protein
VRLRAQATISRSDFITRANTLCTTLDERLDPTTVTSMDTTTETELTTFVTDVMVPEVRKTVKSVRGLRGESFSRRAPP